MTATAPAPDVAPLDTPIARPVRPGASPLMRDALVTIVTRFGLAVLIFATDIVLARLLGPAAKGRFALVLLYSQLAALIVGWGMDQALAVVSGRDARPPATGSPTRSSGRPWSAAPPCLPRVLAVTGLPGDRPGGRPARDADPEPVGTQFMFAALAVPGELFFAARAVRAARARSGSSRTAGSASSAAGSCWSWSSPSRRSPGSASTSPWSSISSRWSCAPSRSCGSAARDGTPVRSRRSRFCAEELRFGTRALPGAVAERLQFRADAFLDQHHPRASAQTGIYSVTSGLAETLWYIPNALGTVMFSRAVDPEGRCRADRRGPDPDDAGGGAGRPRSRRSSSGRGWSGSSTARSSPTPASRSG